MITLRKAQERGHADHGWLDTNHTFSFAGYYDPSNMGFGPLRVINEDRVAPGHGFPMHGHRDMEIVSYVVEGELTHRDSMGNGETLRPGEVQRISAGTGITHSEFNASPTEPVHFLQIWLIPTQPGGKPGYDQRAYPESERRGRLCPVASPDGKDGSIPIRQDTTLYASTLAGAESVTHDFEAGRRGWIQVVKGAVTVNGHPLTAGDGAAIENEPYVTVAATGPGGDVLLFDLP